MKRTKYRDAIVLTNQLLLQGIIRAHQNSNDDNERVELWALIVKIDAFLQSEFLAGTMPGDNVL